MMKHLNFSADITTKRVCDAFYENKLIRDSIFKQTEKRFLNPNIKSNTDQFKYLLDNGIQSKTDLNLASGISLSASQINALTHDIVWMEQKIVQGQ